MRRLALASAALMMLGGLTACGGSPDDASEKDFCDAIEKIGKVSVDDDFDKSKDAVSDLGDVGTPKGISDDARKGFELLVDETDDADSEKDFEKAGDDLSKDEEKQVEAFGEYTAKTCD